MKRILLILLFGLFSLVLGNGIVHAEENPYEHHSGDAVMMGMAQKDAVMMGMGQKDSVVRGVLIGKDQTKAIITNGKTSLLVDLKTQAQPLTREKLMSMDKQDLVNIIENLLGGVAEHFNNAPSGVQVE